MTKLLSLWWNAEMGVGHCIVSEEAQINVLPRRWFDTTVVKLRDMWRAACDRNYLQVSRR